MRNIKKIKEGFKKNWKKCTASAVLAAMLLPNVVSIANAAITWDGWTDKNQEQAWAVFSISQWGKTSSDIIFSNDGSISKSNIPNRFRNAKVPDSDPEDPGKTYEEVVTEVLKEPTFQEGADLAFPAEDYRELLLVVAYHLNKRGESLFSGNGLEKEQVDVCFYGTYVSTKLNITSVRESFRRLMNRYRMVERAYRRAHSGDGSDLFPNIYEIGPSLQSVIQGVLYGYTKDGVYAGFAKSYSDYSEDNAKEYYDKKNKKLPSTVTEDFKSFATEVTSDYTAIRALGDTTVKGW